MTRQILMLILSCGFGLSACAGGAGSGCKSDADCPGGRYCQAGSCTFDCTFNEDCPPGYRCTERGRCERGCVPTNLGVEACDGLDNDCDDETDEDFPDLGLACDLGCGAGLMACAADGLATRCDAREPAADDSECNGLDDDCDDQTDEDAIDLLCPLQAGVCAGAQQTCLGVDGYSVCDYGPAYTEGVDATCDQVDEDCDGQTDEDAQVVLEAEAGSQATDGVDNNCNGLVDEPGGVMVRLVIFENVWIDSYEVTVFQNADCSGLRFGEADDDFPATFPADASPADLQLYACSLPGLIPTGYLSWHRARRACQAQGKRLCTAAEWMMGCSDGGSDNYPYGFGFVPGVCNDGWGGSGQPVPTGSLPLCTAAGRTFDTSGNLAEWVQDADANQPGEAFVGGAGYVCELCKTSTDGSLNCTACDLDNQDDRRRYGNLCACDIDDGMYYSFPVAEALPYLGVRCCMDGP